MIVWKTYTLILEKHVSLYYFKVDLININVSIFTGIISSASESLFTYRPGDSWMTYYFPDFVPMFAPTFTDTSLEDEARNVCGDDTFCLFDIAATKRVEIGAATMEGQEMLNTIMNMSRLSKYIGINNKE